MRFLIFLVLVFIASVSSVEGICCHGTSGCTYCDDCTLATPYCATGSCNIFGCNCDGSCRTGVLCPIGAVGRRGQTVVAGPNCNIPYERLAPHCAIVMPGRFQWEWVHACNTRGKRSISNDGNYSSYLSHLDYSTSSEARNVSEIFKQADVNTDNKISFKEAKAYLIELGIKPRSVKSAFIKLDRNGDKYLTQNEID